MLLPKLIVSNVIIFISITQGKLKIPTHLILEYQVIFQMEVKKLQVLQDRPKRQLQVKEWDLTLNLHFRKITDVGEVTVFIQKPGQTPEDQAIITEVVSEKLLYTMASNSRPKFHFRNSFTLRFLLVILTTHQCDCFQKTLAKKQGLP